MCRNEDPAQPKKREGACQLLVCCLSAPHVPVFALLCGTGADHRKLSLAYWMMLGFVNRGHRRATAGPVSPSSSSRGPGLSFPGGAAASSWQEAHWASLATVVTASDPASASTVLPALHHCQLHLPWRSEAQPWGGGAGTSHLLSLSPSCFLHLYSCNP